MKILHVNSYYLAGKFYKNLYNEQVKQNLNIDVYIPAIKNIQYNFDYGDFTKISPNHSKYDRVFFHVKHKKILKDIKIKYNIKSFDILHAHSLFSNGYIAYKLNKEFKIPYIVAVRSTDINIFFKNMIHLRKLGVEILKNARKIIFLSTPYKENIVDKYIPHEFKKLILNKSIIIPNGIDDFWHKNLYKEKPDMNTEAIKLFYAGLITKRKNLPATLDAINILIEKSYKVQFTIIGKIENKKIFKQFKNKSHITYIPPQQKEELIHFYRENDIFVMPSKSETFGLVYAEAMSQGMPVIYTKDQGFDQQFQEGVVGYHVDCGNSYEIAQRILDIKSNYKTISDNCINLCNKFNWKMIAQAYKSIYGEIDE
jgi:glycosyltransferase involved in cell wall biosynthesis